MSTARSIVVTRTEPPGSGLSGELARLGLPVLHWPVITIVPAREAEWAREREAIDTFDWIVFTSAHAVEAVTESISALPRARVAAVGPSTAETLRERGWRVDVVGDGRGAEALVSAMAQTDLRGRRVLHPASSRALPTLTEELARLGAEVVRFVAYRTAPTKLDTDACRRALEHGLIGAVTFASPSAVIELERALGRTDFDRLLGAVAVLAIGPTTAHELQLRGARPIVAETHTLRGLALAARSLMLTIDPDSLQSNPGVATAHRAEKRLDS